jgi:hypothetical protein
MIMSKLVAWTAAFAFVLGVAHVAPVLAAEGESTQADVVGEASSPSPKSPIKVSIVDYVKEGDGPGTLKLAGTAIASSDVYIYLDDKPFAHIVAADDGKWSVEDKTELDDSAHVVRVEQFDETTRMLAGRAQFNISLSPPDPADMAPRP